MRHNLSYLVTLLLLVCNSAGVAEKPVLDNQAFTQGGFSGRQLHVQQKTSSAYVRVGSSHAAVYQIIVEYPPSAAAQAGIWAPRVFSSFAVTGAPEKP